MARSHAKIACTVWADTDYAELTPTAQWFYAHLLAHPRLSLVGTIDLAERRWARLSKHADETTVTAALTELEAAGYLLIDWDTEEVMVRTFTRHDLAPGRMNKNLAAGFWRAFDGVLSAAIRSAVAHAIPDELWTRLEEYGPPPHVTQIRRSARLEPDKRPRSQPESDLPSQPQVAFPSQPTPPPPSPSDATPALIPQTSPSSSSQSDFTTTTSHDDDEGPIRDDRPPTSRPGGPAPTAAGQRAPAAIELIARQAVARQAERGPIGNHQRYLETAVTNARRDHLATAERYAAAHPDWDAARIARAITDPNGGTVPLEQSRHPAVIAQQRRGDHDDPPVADQQTVRQLAEAGRRALEQARRPHPTGDHAA